jgi:flagellar biosynthetic protein FliO
MKQKKKSSLAVKLLVLLIVSAAFVLARFSIVHAGDTTGQNETVVASHQNQEAGGANDQRPVVESGSLIEPLLKLLAALVIVVAGLYGFLFMLRKMMGAKFSGNKNSRLIEILETTYIAQKKSVSLVRFGDKAVLVGVADGAISALAELTPEETGKVLSEMSAAKPETGFKSAFASAREKMKSLSMKKIGQNWTAGKTDERPQTV